MFSLEKRCRVKVPNVDQHNDSENQYHTQDWLTFHHSSVAQGTLTTVTVLPATFEKIVAVISVSVEKATSPIGVETGVFGIFALSGIWIWKMFWKIPIVVNIKNVLLTFLRNFYTNWIDVIAFLQIFVHIWFGAFLWIEEQNFAYYVLYEVLKILDLVCLTCFGIFFCAAAHRCCSTFKSHK